MAEKKKLNDDELLHVAGGSGQGTGNVSCDSYKDSEKCEKAGCLWDMIGVGATGPKYKCVKKK